MNQHKYRVGQTVRFIATPSSSRLGGTPVGGFRVVRLLPDYLGNNQYRLESTSDGHQRVVTEGEIVLQ